MIAEIIKQDIADAVVYARKDVGLARGYDFISKYQVSVVDNLFPQLNQKQYLLREYDSLHSIDLSLNRCPHSKDMKQSFAPDAFKLCHPTPGHDSDCKGFTFIYENHLKEIEKLDLVIGQLLNQSFTQKVNSSDFELMFNGNKVLTMQQVLLLENAKLVSNYREILTSRYFDDENWKHPRNLKTHPFDQCYLKEKMISHAKKLFSKNQTEIIEIFIRNETRTKNQSPMTIFRTLSQRLLLEEQDSSLVPV